MGRLIVFSIILFLFSCSGEKNKPIATVNPPDSIEKADTLKNQYAEAFRIIEHKRSTEIQILNTQEKEVEFRYIIGESADENSVEIMSELNRIVALSATHIGMLEELDLLEKIVGISDDKYLCSSILKDRIKEGSLKSIGDIGMADIEGYIDVNPDIVIYSGFDTKAPILKKLHSAGIKTFTNYDWKETHPLGRAEWLKVFGVLFNKREKAERLFNNIETAYLNLVNEVAEYSSNETVMVGTLYGDVFNAPAGDSYMAKLLEDANINYKYQETKGTGSISLTLEEVISDNRETDIWLNVAAQSKDKVLEMNNRFRLLRSLQEDQVYSYYYEVNCFWEQSAIRPHVLLLDLCKIAYPDKFQKKKFSFYKKLD